MKKLIVMIVAVFVVTEVAAHHFYSKFPITLKGYTGDKTNSVSLLRADSKTCFT
tara:strand:+ start:164 stop:325 length:162 start_codon:yes stop_codon:yes gene_type:complete